MKKFVSLLLAVLMTAARKTRKPPTPSTSGWLPAPTS